MIAPDIVLTAAHCLNSGGYYNVTVGQSDLSSNEGEDILVAQEIRHPQYNWRTDENDIGLLILSQSVSDVSEDDLVRLNADDSFPSPGDMARTMGWGNTDPDSYFFNITVSDELLEVDLPIISNEQCEAQYDEGWIFDSMICTFFPGRDACDGKSDLTLPYLFLVFYILVLNGRSNQRII